MKGSQEEKKVISSMEVALSLYKGRIFKSHKYTENKDINQKLILAKMKLTLKPFSNMKNQNYLSRRQELIKSLYNQNKSLKFKSETFYQACYFMDLVLLNQKFKLELTAVACLILAAKFIENDSHIPDLRKFENFANKYKFQINDLSETEVMIIKVLQYELSCPSSYQFLNFFLSNGILLKEELPNNNNLALKESPLLAGSTSTNMSSANDIFVEKLYTQAKKILFSFLESNLK